MERKREREGREREREGWLLTGMKETKEEEKGFFHQASLIYVCVRCIRWMAEETVEKIVHYGILNFLL